MATERLDCLGLRCPQPVLKIAAKAPDMTPGDVLEVVGDCPMFEKDVLTWCKRTQKILIAVTNTDGGRKKAQIQF